MDAERACRGPAGALLLRAGAASNLEALRRAAAGLPRVRIDDVSEGQSLATSARETMSSKTGPRRRASWLLRSRMSVSAHFP